MSAVPTSSHYTTSAALAAMLEKEQSSYRRCRPNPNIPLAEYSYDRSLLVDWCRTVVSRSNFRSPEELVQRVSAQRLCCWGLLVHFFIFIDRFLT